MTQKEPRAEEVLGAPELRRSCWRDGVTFQGVLEAAALEQELGRLEKPAVEALAGALEALAMSSSLACAIGEEVAELAPLIRGQRFREAAERLRKMVKED